VQLLVLEKLNQFFPSKIPFDQCSARHFSLVITGAFDFSLGFFKSAARTKFILTSAVHLQRHQTEVGGIYMVNSEINLAAGGSATALSSSLFC
jgi:hypothetical protein